ncbi:NADH:flavin oxidoreductase [Clostridium sp. WILCCON 0269]|uniref:NADH:flavin oxidoreductase n=1 Tax=Candidatus Clostridium eludens TaxID=3381663 RepID=A0ABW8SNG8_9CLOT
MNYLNKPLNTGKLLLKNRLIMPPIATAKSQIDGKISKDILDYYDEKSRGGYISLIIIEHSFISHQGKASNNQMSIAEEGMVEDLKKLAEVIHKNGCKTVMQINHAGSAAKEEITGMEPVGPSAVSNLFGSGAVPRELEKDEIKIIINQFKEAALRVKNAGFDGVEIHSAHGYLLNQFLSPITNKRTDEYGGNITGRVKIHKDIIKNIREAVGESFPIFMRLGACDYMDGGLTIEDSKIAAQQLEKAGVDILDISGGLCRYTIPGVNEEGYFTPLSRAIKEVVSIPVIVTGGVIHAKTADEILSRGEADLVGVGRAIYKDSAWAKNAMK